MTMFCPQCGAPNEDDSVFCGNCGAVLNADEVPAQVEGKVEAEETPGEAEAEAGLEDLGFPVPGEPAMEVLPPPPPPPVRPPQPAAAALPTSGLAIASLLLGIGGLTILPLLGSILATWPAKTSASGPAWCQETGWP
jgi:hypothetical protein